MSKSLADFKTQLDEEVKKTLDEVGALRDQKKQLQSDLSDLLAFKSKVSLCTFRDHSALEFKLGVLLVRRRRARNTTEAAAWYGTAAELSEDADTSYQANCAQALSASPPTSSTGYEYVCRRPAISLGPERTSLSWVSSSIPFQRSGRVRLLLCLSAVV